MPKTKILSKEEFFRRLKELRPDIRYETKIVDGKPVEVVVGLALKTNGGKVLDFLKKVKTNGSIQ